MTLSNLIDHLRFYEELGVTGINRDMRWRQRERIGNPEIGHRKSDGLSTSRR